MRLSLLTLMSLVLATPAHAQEDSKPILVLESGGHLSAVNKVLFTPDGKTLISVSSDKTIRLWDVTSGSLLQVLRVPIAAGPHGQLYAAALSRDGKLLAVAGFGMPDAVGDIYLINLATGKMQQVLKGHKATVAALAFTSDQKCLVSGGGAIGVVWDLATGKARHVLKDNDARIRSLALSPDDKLVVIGTYQSGMRLWSVEDGTLHLKMEGHGRGFCNVAWSPDGKTVASTASDGVISLWNPDGKFRKLAEDEDSVAAQHIQSLQFTPDSQQLLYANSGELPDGRQAGLLDLKTGKISARYRFRNSAYTAALSPDGKLVACGGFHGDELYVWHAADGSLLHRLRGKGAPLWSAGWSKDGKTLSWGHEGFAAPLNGYSRLQRTFTIDRLELGEHPDSDALRAESVQGDLEVSKLNFQQIAVHRKDKELHTWDFQAARCALFLGEQLIVGGDTSFDRFDLGSGQKLSTYKGHTSMVTALAPAPDKKLFASVSADHTLRVWTIDTEEPLLSLYVAGNDWIAWTSEGYYAASPGGEKLMGWQVNRGVDQLASYYPAGWFRKSLYRPEVVRRLLTAQSVKKALEQVNLATGARAELVNVAEVLPPLVVISSPGEASNVVGEAALTVRALVRAAKSMPLVSARLLVNGRPHTGEGALKQFDPPREGQVRLDWSITLAPGKHQLAVLAETAVSRAESELVEVTFDPARGVERVPSIKPAPKPELPTLYILAVGINDYPDKLKLNYATKDAQVFSKTLADHGGTLYRKVEVKLLTNRDATRRNVLQGLTWLKKNMTKRDVGFVFFAGHGERDTDGKFYFLPVDVDQDDLVSTAVPGEQVRSLLGSTEGRLLLLMDACHSGAIDGGKRSARAALTDDLVRDLVAEDCGIVVLCSSMGREVSVESAELEHGLFTLALVEGLSGKADLNKDNVVYLDELSTYLSDRVKALSRGKQHPVMDRPTSVRSFPLAHRPQMMGLAPGEMRPPAPLAWLSLRNRRISCPVPAANVLE